MDSGRQDIVITTKQKLEKEIQQLQQQIKDCDEKKQHLIKFITEKNTEIAETKGKIKDLAEIEEKSKTQIDQHIETLTWLIESIDQTIADLKNKMIDNSEQSIAESAHNFLEYIQDLEEIIGSLDSCKEIEDQATFQETIIGISESLSLFSENIEQSIESMTTLVYKANEEAMNESTKEFEEFVQDIHQIFDTFNNILQKLKLTNSIKKYLEMEEIFIEINHIVDQWATVQKDCSEIKAQKSSKEDELKTLNTYGLDHDFNMLTNYKITQQKKLNDIEQEIHKSQVEQQDLKEKLDFVLSEKNTIRDWFQALTDEVIDRQNEAAATYSIMYSVLDNIHSTISFIKADMRNSSEMAINSIIKDFTKKALNFGRMVGIIKKVEASEDLQKMQRSIEAIAEKSKEYIEEIKQIALNLSKNVRESNLTAIEKSFADFNEFVANFKDKFYIIQEAVSSITLSTSESLINDLEHFSEDQINFREKSIEKDAEVQYDNYLKSTYEKQLQGIENELKIYTGTDDRKHRKYLKEIKSILESNQSNVQEVQWEIKNDGIVPFTNFQVLDFLMDGVNPLTISRENNSTLNYDNGRIFQWNIASLDKRETIQIRYDESGFPQVFDKNNKNLKNINTPKTFRYRNLGQPITLTFIERDGYGALILTNTGEKDKIWNIHIEFEENSDITPEHLILNISYLNPQESYIKKYEYKKAGVLTPKFFFASAKHAVGVIKKRSIDRENSYNFELIFENHSEFLMHMTSFEGFLIDNLQTPIFQVKAPHLDVIKPRLDFREEITIESPQDPPNVVMLSTSTLELVYDFDVDRRISIEDLKETPEKDVILEKHTKKGKQKAAVAPIIRVENVQTIEVTSKNAELVSIDREIDNISQEIKSTELKITMLKAKYEQKVQDRKELEKKIKDKEEQDRLKKIKEQQEKEAILELQRKNEQEMQQKIQELKNKAVPSVIQEILEKEKPKKKSKGSKQKVVETEPEIVIISKKGKVTIPEVVKPEPRTKTTAKKGKATQPKAIEPEPQPTPVSKKGKGSQPKVIEPEPQPTPVSKKGKGSQPKVVEPEPQPTPVSKKGKSSSTKSVSQSDKLKLDEDTAQIQDQQRLDEDQRKLDEIGKKINARFKPEVREIKPEQVVKEEKAARKELQKPEGVKKTSKKSSTKATSAKPAAPIKESSKKSVNKKTTAKKETVKKSSSKTPIKSSSITSKKGKQSVLPTKKSGSKR